MALHDRTTFEGVAVALDLGSRCTLPRPTFGELFGLDDLLATQMLKLLACPLPALPSNANDMKMFDHTQAKTIGVKPAWFLTRHSTVG